MTTTAAFHTIVVPAVSPDSPWTNFGSTRFQSSHLHNCRLRRMGHRVHTDLDRSAYRRSCSPGVVPSDNDGRSNRTPTSHLGDAGYSMRFSTHSIENHSSDGCSQSRLHMVAD